MNKKKKDEFGTYEYAEGIGKEYANMNYDTFKQGSDYAGLKKTYVDSGQKAMKDTVGQVAARTGGLASSYAQAAGQQAYGDWMSRLEDAAYSMYGAKKDEKLNEYNLAKDAANTNKALTDEAEAKKKAEEDEAEAKRNKLFMLDFASGETPDTLFPSISEWAGNKDITHGEDGNVRYKGLTEDEINYLYKEYLASQPAAKENDMSYDDIMAFVNMKGVTGEYEFDASTRNDLMLELLKYYNYLDDEGTSNINRIINK